jgi:four helix bundle protein
MQDFKALKVWQKAHEYVLLMYRATGGFPKDEMFGLRSQIRRCSVSISANIAEGCGRLTSADFAHFLTMAMGSACEAEYYLILSRDLGYVSPNDHHQLDGLLQETKRMLSSLIARVRNPKATIPQG